MNKTFHIVTFGCQMNARDSQWLESALSSRGYASAPLESAAVIAVNTCSVREKPEQKVRTFLRRASLANPDALICVFGCVAQQLGESLGRYCPQVRLVAGADGMGGAPDAIERLLENKAEKAFLLDFATGYQEREADRQPGKPAAFVNIMQGCDNFCSYCIVPFTRGRQKSRSLASIIAESRQRLDEGSREIVLLGQNVSAWRADGKSFADLLIEAAKLDGLERLRFVTSHPRDIDISIIEAIATLPVICPSIHLPLQSGSSRILKAMRRGYGAEEYLHLAGKLKSARPDLTLATDLIVGFPGETEQDFQETLEMVKACGFATGFSFCYSDRPGTRASLMPDKIAREIQLDRLARLQSQLESQSLAWLDSRVGKTTSLLVEGPSGRGGTWQGRDPWGTVVNVPLPAGMQEAGRILQVKITQAKKHSLFALPAENR